LKYSSITSGVALVALMAMGGTAAQATVTYDDNVTTNVIVGDGIGNGGFTIDRDNGVELGLRGKLRFDTNGLPQNTYNSNGDGTYSFDTGAASGSDSWVAATTPIWNFEWSINTDYTGQSNNPRLAGMFFQLDIDFDAGLGTNFLSLDPVHGSSCYDNGLGFNFTGQGDGSEVDCSAPGAAAQYAAELTDANLAQNSWNMEFFNEGAFSSFDPNANGTYTFTLTAFDGNQQRLAQTSIDIIVGTGANQVPEPATLGLMGIGLAGLGFAARRKRKAA
jgi:hypothetical protein